MFTIVKDFRQEIVIEKSRFICTLKKVQSEAEAQEFIKTIKKEFWDATPKKIYSQLDIHTSTRKQQVENMKSQHEKKNNKNEHTETLKAIKK